MFALLLFSDFITSSLQLDSQFHKGRDLSKEYFVLPQPVFVHLTSPAQNWEPSASPALKPRIGQVWTVQPAWRQSTLKEKMFFTSKNLRRLSWTDI